MEIYDRDRLPTGVWGEYRKVTTIKAARMRGPCKVVTSEGTVELGANWDG